MAMKAEARAKKGGEVDQKKFFLKKILDEFRSLRYTASDSVTPCAYTAGYWLLKTECGVHLIRVLDRVVKSGALVSSTFMLAVVVERRVLLPAPR